MHSFYWNLGIINPADTLRTIALICHLWLNENYRAGTEKLNAWNSFCQYLFGLVAGAVPGDYSRNWRGKGCLIAVAIMAEDLVKFSCKGFNLCFNLWRINKMQSSNKCRNFFFSGKGNTRFHNVNGSTM